MTAEGLETRLKRLRIRSWRRGTREMDLLLGPFSDTALASLTASELDLYEQLLTEADTDLYSWLSGRAPMPDRYAGLAAHIWSHHGATSQTQESPAP